MDLFTIQHRYIADSSEESWYKVAAQGTYYRHSWSHGCGGESRIESEHRRMAVYRPDPSLTIAWGMQADGEEPRTAYDWSQGFPNTAVWPIFADVFWCGALIDRVELARIDGAHGIIPLPNYANEVTHYELAVAFLLHALQEGRNHDNPGRYVERLGFKVITDLAREDAGNPALNI